MKSPAYCQQSPRSEITCPIKDGENIPAKTELRENLIQQRYRSDTSLRGLSSRASIWALRRDPVSYSADEGSIFPKGVTAARSLSPTPLTLTTLHLAEHWLNLIYMLSCSCLFDWICHCNAVLLPCYSPAGPTQKLLLKVALTTFTFKRAVIYRNHHLYSGLSPTLAKTYKDYYPRLFFVLPSCLISNIFVHPERCCIDCSKTAA